MSSKREEVAAFKRLRKAFPDVNCALECWYTSWYKELRYYCTVPSVGSTIGNCTPNVNEAVDLMIKMKGE